MVADVTKPLLGFDLLNNFGLIVDCDKITSSSDLVNLVVNKFDLLGSLQELTDK